MSKKSRTSTICTAAEPAAVARTPAVAAASPGKMTAFSADIAALLMRASPKHPGSSGRGRVVVRFTLAETGRLDGVRVLTSSGHPRLDAAAREVIERVRFPVPPAGMSTAQRTYDKEYEFR